MTVRILQGDCRDVLKTLEPGSVQCCVTSPPYFGLRDYGHAEQIGLESTPDAYVAAMVEVFRCVRDVLADDGTLWINLGDSYAGSWGAQSREHAGKHAPNVSALSANQVKAAAIRESGTGPLSRTPGCKPKDLIGIPWMIAFALRADGWYLRQDIIWHKPNPMPESVRDRCTKAHEYVFLLSKSKRYYFDADAIAEPCASSAADIARARITGRGDQAASSAFLGSAQRDKSGGFPCISRSRKALRSDVESRHRSSIPGGQSMQTEPDGWRNRRSVWTIPTKPYAEAHFAAMAPDLARDCVLAGCPEGDTVLDPFGGAGTTGLVADRLQRNAVLIELNPAYADLARARIAGDAPLFAEVA